MEANIRQVVRAHDELSDQIEAILRETSDPGAGEIQMTIGRIEQLEVSFLSPALCHYSAIRANAMTHESALVILTA